MTIDHTGIYVHAPQHPAVVEWYKKALGPLGYYVLRAEGPNNEITGFSDTGEHGDWWVVASPEPRSTFHHAFTAKDRAQVDAFHAAAVAAGGKDNGKPGPRDHFGPNYYAAFVMDPIGNNIEVVCRAKP